MKSDKRVVERIADDLERIRETRPLLHHITNFVVMNETANLTLCLGGLPIMSHAKEEVAEMVQMASALVLNIGTLTPDWVESMLLAGKEANARGIPVVLDPVGAGATALRTDSARNLISEVKLAAVRGNAAEVSILAGHEGKIKGVESVEAGSEMARVAGEFAAATGCVVAVTGAEDVVSDGQRLATVRNGHVMLSRMTGTGCMATTALAGFCAVDTDYFQAALGGLVTFGLAGEKAAEAAAGRPGSFHVALYDYLAGLTKEDIVAGAKLEVE